MAFLTLQVGQCGNQVGKEFYDTITSDLEEKEVGVSVGDNHQYMEESMNRFFSRVNEKDKKLLRARSILIDTEDRVVESVLKGAGDGYLWDYARTNAILESGGAGNNWAYGFNQRGPELRSQCLETIRCELEECDSAQGFLCFLSAAGGTGSGVGTYISQVLREEYPRKSLLNIVVLPYDNGEVIVQQYNTLFTLSRLYSCSDGIILYSNDALQKDCSNYLKMNHVSMTNLNQLLCHTLASVLQPACTLPSIVQQVSCHPKYKFLSINALPLIPRENRRFETFKWLTILKELKKCLYGVENHRLSCKSLANFVILRGADLSTLPPCTAMFEESKIYPTWMPKSGTVKIVTQPRQFSGLNMSATLLANNGNVCRSLRNITKNALSLYNSRAYVHHYEKYDILSDDFKGAFMKFDNFITSYQEL